MHHQLCHSCVNAESYNTGQLGKTVLNTTLHFISDVRVHQRTYFIETQLNSQQSGYDGAATRSSEPLAFWQYTNSF